MRSLARLLAATAALLLAGGCTTPPEKYWRPDGKPLAAQEEAALLAYTSSRAFPHQVVTSWNYHLKSIDGKPVPNGKAFVQLDPGEYTVTLDCGARFSATDPGWLDGEHTVTVKVEAGKTYWAWIATQQDVYKREKGLAGTLPGRCWASGFKSRDPFFDTAG